VGRKTGSLFELQMISTMLIKERKERGISGRKFAKLIGVANSTLSNYENMKQFPSPEILTKMEAIGLNISDHYLSQRYDRWKRSEYYKKINRQRLLNHIKTVVRMDKLGFHAELDTLMLIMKTFVEKHEVEMQKRAKRLERRKQLNQKKLVPLTGGMIKPEGP